MTKTNYEKELEREIDRYRELSKMSYEVGGDNDYQYEIHYLKAKLEGYKKAKQEERERILKKINKELKLWKEAFPQQKELLKNFSNKIKLEIKINE